MSNHEHFMKMALSLAEHQAGSTWPNPFVGAVLVRAQVAEGDSALKDNQVVASAVTANGGRPHAETQTIEQAGAAAKDATLYVTLEPCAHDGQTPPCVDAIIAAGIRQVVIACTDPDPRTAGQSIDKLKAAGVDVIEGVCEEDARWQHRGFFSLIERGRPWVTLKMAASLDGKVALANGESKWITGEQAREHGHHLRAQNDAILSTSRSIAKDNSKLTCRLPGMEHRSPIRIVMDRNLRLEGEGDLFEADDSPIWIITYKDAEQAYELPPYAQLFTLQQSKHWLGDLFRFLGEQGLTRVLVETGGTFASALLGEGLVDELQWFTAPIIIGDDGISAVKALNAESLEELHRAWSVRETRQLGEDRLSVLVRQANMGVK